MANRTQPSPESVEDTDLAGRRVWVAGAGAAGRSAGEYLTTLGAIVSYVDDRTDDGQTIDEALAAGFDALDLLIVSPGFAPTHQLIVAAQDAGVACWGEVELAWRVDRAALLGEPRTWLVITGTNGKTTTTGMVEAIMTSAGYVAKACGNYGLTVLDALRSDPRVEMLCVELSSFQLHWAPSVSADAAVVLNIAEDHLDWHGSFDAYAQAKGRALAADVAVVNVDDPVTAALAVGVDSRRVGFTAGHPQAGQLGVVDGQLVDAAFVDAGRESLISVEEIRPGGPSGVADALAAAALARAVGVSPGQIAEGLRTYSPAAHRGDVVATIGGVRFVDDSKATNPHAAVAALAAHRRVVLVAGGLLKGASVDDLIAGNAERLAAVVAIGRDRELIVDAIVRHAPHVPTVTVFTGDDGQVTVIEATAAAASLGISSAISSDFSSSRPHPELGAADAVMTVAVQAAWKLGDASTDPIDAVLLAPAAASLDMFVSYSARGDAFADASRKLAASIQDAS